MLVGSPVVVATPCEIAPVAVLFDSVGPEIDLNPFVEVLGVSRGHVVPVLIYEFCRQYLDEFGWALPPAPCGRRLRHRLLALGVRRPPPEFVPCQPATDAGTEESDGKHAPDSEGDDVGRT